MKIFILILALSLLTGCSASVSPSFQEVSNPPVSIETAIPAPIESPLVSAGLEYYEQVIVESAALGYDENKAVNEMTSIMEGCKDLLDSFKVINTFDGVYFDVSEEERQALLSRIGEMGYVTADARMDMLSPEQVREFYRAYELENDAEVGVYIFGSGQISRLTFLCKSGVVYSSVTTVRWDSNMQPIIECHPYMYELEIFTLTPKGYLFYGSDELSTRAIRTVSGLRVEPLGEENRRILREYVDPLISYASTGVFSLDWDAADLRSLHLNDVFELLYKKEYGVEADTVFTDAYYDDAYYPKAVPAAEFEAVITKYFPVTAEELRNIAVYNSDKQAYAFEPMTMLQDASPDWEVVDFTRNPDGTLTIVMDGVRPENLLDRCVSNTVTILLKGDGSYQYLSNRVTHYELDAPSSVPNFQEYFPRVK